MENSTKNHNAVIAREQIKSMFDTYVIPSYSRFDIVLSHGHGPYVWDINGKRYLDFAAGIAVNALGHTHHEIIHALSEQASKLGHISNYYYHENQGRLAETLVKLIGPGKCFFCNSGAEANEGLFKLARKFGHDEGRFEILTAVNSFHGRTLAGISATGQEKVKKGFEPMVPGFRHIPFNDLDAARSSISPGTIAILIEGIQGEGGVTAATPEYLLGLRKLCDEFNLLLLMDEVQCGFFRTGKFLSYQRILENIDGAENFAPDAISFAKAIASGFPMGAIWVSKPYQDLLGPGSHASTFGGNPVACAVALKTIEIIQRDNIVDNVRNLGEYIKQKLIEIASHYPDIITSVRGMGFMLAIELNESVKIKAETKLTPAMQFLTLLHDKGLLAVPAGQRVIRLLPPLNITKTEADMAVEIINSVVGLVS